MKCNYSICLCVNLNVEHTITWSDAETDGRHICVAIGYFLNNNEATNVFYKKIDELFDRFCGIVDSTPTTEMYMTDIFTCFLILLSAYVHYPLPRCLANEMFEEMNR